MLSFLTVEELKEVFDVFSDARHIAQVLHALYSPETNDPLISIKFLRLLAEFVEPSESSHRLTDILRELLENEDTRDLGVTLLCDSQCYLRFAHARHFTAAYEEIQSSHPEWHADFFEVTRQLALTPTDKGSYLFLSLNTNQETYLIAMSGLRRESSIEDKVDSLEKLITLCEKQNCSQTLRERCVLVLLEFVQYKDLRISRVSHRGLKSIKTKIKDPDLKQMIEAMVCEDWSLKRRIEIHRRLKSAEVHLMYLEALLQNERSGYGQHVLREAIDSCRERVRQRLGSWMDALDNLSSSDLSKRVDATSYIYWASPKDKRVLSNNPEAIRILLRALYDGENYNSWMISSVLKEFEVSEATRAHLEEYRRILEMDLDDEIIEYMAKAYVKHFSLSNTNNLLLLVHKKAAVRRGVSRILRGNLSTAETRLIANDPEALKILVQALCDGDNYFDRWMIAPVLGELERTEAIRACLPDLKIALVHVPDNEEGTKRILDSAIKRFES